MARRKVSGTKRKSPAKRKTTTRRRRISGVSGNLGDMAMHGLALGAGAIAAREGNALLQKVVTVSPMMSGAGQVVVGVMLPKLMKGNKFIAGMGDGMIANGLMVMAVSTGIISGKSDRVTYKINGVTRNRAIAGSNGGRIPTIAGAPGANIPTLAGRSRRGNGGKSVGCV